MDYHWQVINHGNQIFDEMKWEFFQTEAICTIVWLLQKCNQTIVLANHLEKKPNGNYTRMLHAILNKSWKQHPTNQHLYGHLLPISETIQTRHAGHSWISEDELISDILWWTPTHGHTIVGQLAEVKKKTKNKAIFFKLILLSLTTLLRIWKLGHNGFENIKID